MSVTGKDLLGLFVCVANFYNIHAGGFSPIYSWVGGLCKFVHFYVAFYGRGRGIYVSGLPSGILWTK
jgi:hypothetical protein